VTVRTAAQALAFVEKHGVVTLAARVPGVPCFVEAVAGEKISGSWWGHPKGKLIFALAEGLDDSDAVLSLKLLDGKATFVANALWPVVLAVVLDAEWRAVRAKTLGSAARGLWKKVEASSVRGGPPGTVKELEASLLVHAASEHTEKGRHEKRLTGWAQWGAARGVRAAEVSAEVALAKLRKAAGGVATTLEDR
jgi:hypothetical protein